MPAEAGRPLTREDLLDAWLDTRRYERAHDDLRLFHARRLEALQSALSTDLARGPREAPPSAPGWFLEGAPESQRPELSSPRRIRGLQLLFEAATVGLLSADSPFGGYLETPPAVAALYERHHRALRDAAQATERARRQLLLDLLELMWGLSPDVRVDRAAAPRVRLQP